MWKPVRWTKVDVMEPHPTYSERNTTMTVLRKLLIAVPVALGLVAVAAGPASAGLVLANHCRPSMTSGIR